MEEKIALILTGHNGDKKYWSKDTINHGKDKCDICKNGLYGTIAIIINSGRGSRKTLCTTCRDVLDRIFSTDDYGRKIIDCRMGEIFNLRERQIDVIAILTLLNYKVLPNELIRTLKKYFY